MACWGEMMIDKQNMEKVPLVQDQWKIVLLQGHIHQHHLFPLVGIRMPFSEGLTWFDEDHTDGLHPKEGCSMYQK